MSVSHDHSVNFSFGTIRLLLAVTVFAAGFAFTKPLGQIGIPIALLILCVR